MRASLVVVLATSLGVGCALPCASDTVLLELQLAPDLSPERAEALTMADELRVRVGANPASAIRLEGQLVAGTRIEVDLAGAYRPGASARVFVTAWRDGTALAAGGTELVLDPGCATSTVVLGTDLGAAAGAPQAAHTTLTIAPGAGILADGVARASIELQAADADGLPAGC